MSKKAVNKNAVSKNVKKVSSRMQGARAVWVAVGVLALDGKLAAEAAGAAGLAALLTGRIEIEPDTQVAVVISGGNVDPALLASAVTTPH